MKKKSPGRAPQYEATMKIAIAREYLTGNLGYGELAKKYGLSKETIRHFVTWYKENNVTDDEGQTSAVPAAVNAPFPSLTDQPADKDKQLEEAHLKIAALEMLIANAQKELGIDLIKKPGAKQSNK
jgi:transposase-like protein